MAKPVFKELLDRQTRVTLICSYFIALFFGAILAVIFFVYQVRSPLLTLSVIYVGAVLLNVLLYEAHGRIFLTYQALIVMSYLEIVAVASFTGGMRSPAIFILTLFPVAAFSTSRKQGTAWSAVTFLTLLLFFPEDGIIPVSNTITTDESEYLFAFASVLFVLALSVVISYLVNRTTFAVHRSFERGSKELEFKSRRLENLATLLNYSTDLMCIVDLKTLVVDDLNPIFKIELGYELSEVTGSKLISLIKKEKRSERLEEEIRALKEDQIIEFDCKLTCKNGEEKEFSWMGIAKNGKLHAIAREGLKE